jgi:hypothetical protein
MIETSLLSASAVTVDELDRVDNVRNIGKALIRATFYRSVSFMKKSFNRSNSSLSVASTDSSVGGHDDSSHFSYSGTRSCMKGTRASVVTNGETKFNRNNRVRFKRSHDKIIKIEPFFEYAEDLWYTKSEERHAFTLPGLDSVSDAVNAETYMKAYTAARKQVYPKAWFEGKEQIKPEKPEKLSAALFDEIVKGRTFGFAGLEQYSINLKRIRRVHIQQTVIMICAAYYDSMSRLDIGSTDEKEKLVRNYAKSLTAVDRYWSAAMGQADADAAALVYDNDSNCQIDFDPDDVSCNAPLSDNE